MDHFNWLDTQSNKQASLALPTGLTDNEQVEIGTF